MLELNTERLRIACLDLDNFRSYIYEHGNMQRRIGIQATTEALPDELQKVFLSAYEQAMADKKNYVWYTVWQIVSKIENCAIGGVCFKGRPNIDGEVEIGYGTEPAHQNKGYMTEAVKSIIQWAIKQDGVMYVIAETEKSNNASHKVLEKNGMAIYKETDISLWWRYNGV
ncbi:GNAT family N-acetyltransferase [Methanomethylovorans sp.]|uniref:GNAT family N-acetyltransferase n=1 Tax=Methanomethylovorans sp. TaxID=2758717 RepID=UPI00351C95FE